jgi:hypothetical protein
VIAARLHLGRSDSANARLHEWLRSHPAAEDGGREKVDEHKTNQADSAEKPPCFSGRRQTDKKCSKKIAPE